MSIHLTVRALRVVALVLGITWSMGTHARTRWFLDFDGSQVYFRTPWVLRRIDKLRTPLQPNPVALGLPERIEISETEYRQHAALFGKGDAKIGSLTPLTLDDDPILKRPRVIIPGFYAVDSQITFERFRPSSSSIGNLRKDLHEAEARVKSSLQSSEGEPYAWEGPAMALVVKAMSNRESVGDMVTASARWLGDSEWGQYLRDLKRRKRIRYTRDLQGQHPPFRSLGDPEALLIGRGNLGQLKVEAMRREAAYQLKTMTKQKMHLELASNPTLAAEGLNVLTDTLVVAENEPEYVEPMRRALEALSAEYLYGAKMKFVLLNAGAPRDLADIRHPQPWTVFYRGLGRPATEAEIRAWTEPSCAASLVKN